MRLTRIHVGGGLRADSRIELPADAATHVARVLRARSGDSLVLFDGRGGEYPGVIESVKGTSVRVSVGAHRAVERESPLAVSLVQCIPRGDRMDLIVQKTVELGVADIAPVVSQRSVVRLDKAQGGAKSAHWQAVAVSACEQCGRNRIPAVAAALPLLDHLGKLGEAQHEARWVLEPDEAESPAAGALAAGATATGFAAAGPASRTGSAAAAVRIAVGPEGGFAPEELEAFRVCGFARLTLGPRILRTETAAIAAVAWLQSRFGDM